MTVFFEMCHPFATGMERIEVLRDLRKPQIIFPAAWTGSRQQATIVNSLLSHDPEQRPSAIDLLHSGLVQGGLDKRSVDEGARIQARMKYALTRSDSHTVAERPSTRRDSHQGCEGSIRPAGFAGALQ